MHGSQAIDVSTAAAARRSQRRLTIVGDALRVHLSRMGLDPFGLRRLVLLRGLNDGRRRSSGIPARTVRIVVAAARKHDGAHQEKTRTDCASTCKDGFHGSSQRSMRSRSVDLERTVSDRLVDVEGRGDCVVRAVDCRGKVAHGAAVARSRVRVAAGDGGSVQGLRMAVGHQEV